MKVALVCSSGGHLLQIYRLQPWREKYEWLWVTFRKPDSLSLFAGEEVAWAYVPRLFVRYKDLVRSTRPEMQRILKHAGLVSLLTWPLLLRYGYLGRGGPGGKQR